MSLGSPQGPPSFVHDRASLLSSLVDAHGAVHFHRQLGTLVRALQAAGLLSEADADGDHRASEKPDVAAFFIRTHLVPGYDPEADPDYTTRIDRIVAPDTDTPSR